MGAPDILRMPIAQVREIQDRNLREQIELCAVGSPYYRRVFANEDIDPSRIATTDDLMRLPVTPKLAFAQDPEAFRLSVPDLPLEERMIWEVMYTTGTTSGQPAIMYTTTFDHYAFLVQTARAGELSGFRSTDIFANLIPLAPFPMGAFIRTSHHAASIGAAVANAHPGHRHAEFPVHRSLDAAIDLIERHKATVVFGVGGFVRRMLIRAIERGADFSSVRICAVTGEYCSPSMREDLKSKLRELGAENLTLNDRYGSTELGLLTQCTEGGPYHNPAPDFVFLEVVHEETHERIPDGERGLLVMTHLRRRGTVMLRYAIGDVVSMTHEPCPSCGRTAERIVGPPVRTKELVKIKGMLINPDIVKNEIVGTSGVEEFQIIFRKQDSSDINSMDQLAVRVAIAGRSREQVADELQARILAAVGVSPVVEFDERTAIYDPERRAKPERVIDLRPTPPVE